MSSVGRAPSASKVRGAGRWGVRPGDLPSARLAGQAAEPGRVEENAVYRSMLFGSRSRGMWSRLPPMPRGIVLGFLIFFITGIFSTFWPLMILVWALGRGQKSRPARFFNIPEAMLDDLLHAPLSPRDWSEALWANALRPGGRSAAPWAFLTFFLLLEVMVVVVVLNLRAPPVQAYAWLAGSSGLLAGWLLMMFAPSATAPLPALSRQLRGFRIDLFQRRHPFLRVLSTLFRLAGLLLLIFLGGGAVFALAMAVPIAASTMTLGRWAAQPFAPAVCFVTGLLAATAIGLARRLQVKRNRNDYLDMMDRDLSKIIEHLRYQEEGEKPPSARRGARPKAARSGTWNGPDSIKSSLHHVR